MLDPHKYIKDCKVIVGKEAYAILKAKKIDLEAFANIVDKNEITIIIDQNKLRLDNVIEVVKDWKLLTFDVTLPFELVGFLAIIAQELAKSKVSIFAISAYSTDHILVKAKDLPNCLKTLSDLGCQVIQ